MRDRLYPLGVALYVAWKKGAQPNSRPLVVLEQQTAWVNSETGSSGSDGAIESTMKAVGSGQQSTGEEFVMLFGLGL